MGIIDELKKKGLVPKGKIGLTYTSEREDNGSSISDLPYDQAIIELTQNARKIEGVRIETTGGITFFYGKDSEVGKDLQVIQDPEVLAVPIYPPSERQPKYLVRKGS